MRVCVHCQCPKLAQADNPTQPAFVCFVPKSRQSRILARDRLSVNAQADIVTCVSSTIYTVVVGPWGNTNVSPHPLKLAASDYSH